MARAKLTEEEKAARREARLDKKIEEALKTCRITTYIRDENGNEIWLSRKENGVWVNNPDVPEARRREQATKIRQTCADAVLRKYGYKTVVDPNGV